MHDNDRPISPPEKSRSDEASMPTLREFWEELQRAKAAQEALDLPRAGSGGSMIGSGFASASGSGSGGSGGGGYGLGLIAADEESQRRIRAIMQELCEKDAGKR